MTQPHPVISIRSMTPRPFRIGTKLHLAKTPSSLKVKIVRHYDLTGLSFEFTVSIKNNFMAQHERGEHRMHFFSNGLALLNRNMDDSDCSHTTVTAVRADLNAAIDSFFG